MSAILDTRPPPSVSSVSAPAAPVLTLVPLEIPHRRPPTSLLPCLCTAAILAAFLQHIPWESFLALSQASKQVRLFYDQSQEARDIVLSRYIPTYRQVLSLRNRNRVQDIHVSLHDLNLFLKSQTIELYRYPTHTLTLASFPEPDESLNRQTRMLAALAQAHSRLVLLIQSIVHSSPLPLDSETFSGNRTTMRLSKSSLRELTFPAPLALGHPSASVSSHVHDHQSPATPRSPARSVTLKGRGNALLRPSVRDRNAAAMANRRSSIFDFGPSAPPLPPPSEPKSLTTLSRGWRRSMYVSTDDSTSLSKRSFRGRTDFGSTEEGLATLAKLHPSRHGSSDSDSSGSRIPTPSIPPRSQTDTPVPNEQREPASPHDLNMATLRTRAPVLRVFVPCSELTVDSNAETGTITRCEDQLCDSGLWNYLSVGDIICNLGFVPFADNIPSPSNGTRFSAISDGSSSSSGSSWDDMPSRPWLIFDGNGLVPYCPPHPLPVPDALSLPTPYYYSHLMAETENPLFVLNRLPPIRNIDGVLNKLQLCHVPSSVPSPNSPMGFALVKKHVWTAQIRVSHQPLANHDASQEIGEGWCGTWIIESQGTKEGRLLLEKILRSQDVGGTCYWELVRDRSQKGRLWFRLLHWTRNL